MTTELTLDDDLYRAAAAAAEARGISFSDFVADAIELAVASAVGARRTTRNGVPVIVVPGGTPMIDPAKVRHAIEENGF
jgi:hypothetical protein